MSSLQTDLLPVPYDCLVELGLTDEQIREALDSRPLVLACQAPDHPGAWYDVDRAKKALRALGQFRHTKGRWAGVPIRLGQGLDPWQVVWVLAPIFGWVYHDPEIDRVVRVIRTAWIEVPRKAGKALALDTPVPTPTGWTTQGDLVAGDEVLSAAGVPTRVVATTAVLHDRPCYRLTLDGGETIVADAGHLWRDAAGSLRTTQEIANRGAAELAGGRHVLAAERVDSVPVKCIQVDDPDGMYLAGRSLVPTHNSTLSSAISNILLLADGEMGAEVYNAAGSTLQAGRVFEDAKRMLLTSPAARKRINPLKEVVEVPRTGGVLRCLSRVAETAHGLNVSGAVVDEVHTLRLLRALVEAIETGVGARDQPLIIFITTADDAEEGTVYDEKHSYTRNLANRVVEDTRHYGVIWAAEHSDDPFSDETIRKANPGAGKSPTWTYLHGEAKKAQNNPTYLPTYLRLTLNLRQRNQIRWFDLNDWDACAGADKRAALRKRRAWGGLDLSAVSDLSAWSVWVEPIRPAAELELLTRLWVPEGAVEELEKRLRVPLAHWIDQGFVEATDGDVIDYSVIESAVIGDTRHFDMQRISYDRMFAGQLVQNVDLATKGVDVLPVAQTFAGLSAACKEMERLVRSRSFRHDSNPALRWMASAVEVKNDGLDNIRPVKPDRAKASSRIDGIQAAVTGLDGWVRRPKQAERRKVVVGRG